MMEQIGVLQAAGIVWCVIGFITAVLSIQNFRQKSKIADLIIRPEANTSKEEKRLYRIIGYIFLYLSVISFLFGAFCLLNNPVFITVASGLALSGILIIVIRTFTGYRD